jgi:hypothetical protein
MSKESNKLTAFLLHIPDKIGENVFHYHKTCFITTKRVSLPQNAFHYHKTCFITTKRKMLSVYLFIFLALCEKQRRL